YLGPGQTAPGNIPLWWVSGNQSGPLAPGSNGASAACYGPSWVFHILSEMEKSPLAKLMPQAMDQNNGLSNSDYYECNPADNLDGTPFRRPDIQFQIPLQVHMTCPSSGTDPQVEYTDLSMENLVKGNYVACFGGDSYIHATPVGNPNMNMLGV